MPLPVHIAQKLHGMSLPPQRGRQNERFRDLIDLLLVEEIVTDYAGLRQACESVFRARGTHDWPPPLAAPRHWTEPFARLARDVNLPVTDIRDGLSRVQELVNRIVVG